jgi:hypothetical protein
VVLLVLKVTATLEAGVAQLVAEALGTAFVVVVSVVGLLEVGGFGLVPVPEPAILISAQVK